MLTVLKYPLPELKDIRSETDALGNLRAVLRLPNPADVIPIRMPYGARVVQFNQEYGRPTIWALVETDSPVVEHRFVIVVTGNDLSDYSPNELEHVGTISVLNDRLILHLFRIVP